MAKKAPDTIITATKNGRTSYVFNAPFNADNKRRPTYTEDVEKAKRLWDEEQARTYISRFVPQPGYTYDTEKFVPATV